MIIDARPGKPVFIGRLGENEARTIRFFVGDVLHDFPGAEVTLLNQRPGDPAGYPVVCEASGNYLLWNVQSGDMSRAGNGKCEMIATVDGVIAKSVIYTTEIGESLDGSTEPPDPWKSWVDEVTEAAQRAEEAVEIMEHPGAEAQTLEPGSEATAGYSEGTFLFGIPAGEKGEKGDTGEKGETGTPGSDGFSPSASVSKTGKTATITITDRSGTTSESVSDGQDGAPGQDGHTPVRGVDYWTAEDRESVISETAEGIIDDSAGAGGTDVAWSADKTARDAVKKMLQADEIPDTVQEISFDGEGNVSEIVHSADGSPVRTDTFTFSEGSITEVRTLSTGQKLTISTDTETLAVTVTYTE